MELLTSEKNKQFWSVADAKRCNRKVREQYLRDAWGLPDLRVRGRLEQGPNDIWWLADVRDENGQLLEYPLADYESEPGLGNRDVYVAHEVDIDPEFRRQNTDVTAQAYITSQAECEKRGNPLRIRVDPGSMYRLAPISRDLVFHNEDGSIAIAETVRENYIAQCRSEANAELSELTDEIARIIPSRYRFSARPHR